MLKSCRGFMLIEFTATFARNGFVAWFSNAIIRSVAVAYRAAIQATLVAAMGAQD